MKRTDKTTIKQIANYWMENATICETELNFDWADCGTHCWNCGDDKLSSTGKVRLERCHIIPHSLGGEDLPSNYVLMCAECHATAPNSTNPKYMWEWIKSNRMKFWALTGSYKFDKAIQLFEQRRKITLTEVISNAPNNFMQIFKDSLRNIQTHGQLYNIESYYTLLCEVEDSVNNSVLMSESNLLCMKQQAINYNN